MNITKPQKMIYNMVKVDGDAVATNCSSLLVDGEKSISDIQAAVNGLFYLNDILRVRFFETNGVIEQEFCEFSYRNFEVLSFENKEELDAYAESYVKEPLVYTESVCDFKIVILNGKYGLLVKLHHIISDAWTFGLIFTQFEQLLNKVEIEAGSYSDYVESEKNYLSGNRYEKDKSYFLKQIKKCDSPVFLSDREADSTNATRRIFVLEKDAAEKIRDFAKEKECSVFSLFSLALAIYISKVKINAERLFIGTTILNRNNNRELNTAGIFVNSVPMLFELDESKSFEENLELAEDSLMSLFRHQKYSYSDLLSHLSQEKHAPKKLYDVMINYMNAVVDVTDKNIQSTWYYNGRQHESLVLNIDDRDQKSVFKMHYDYQTEKFTENEIEMLHGHLCRLIFDAIEHPDKKITELNMLSSEEKKKLLYDFNNTAAEYPKDKCIHSLFEEQVEKNPDKTAVIACDKTLTYRQLNEDANRIANSLIEMGIGKGDIVGLMLPRKSFLLAALFGILKTGAAYLPIDSELPKERIDYMCNDTKARVVISAENIDSFLNSENTSNPDVEISNDSLCYCIYTSGSTGQPKGVMAMHRNVVNYISKNRHNIAGGIITDDFEAIVSISTCSFDIFITETVLPLVNGIRTVLADEQQCRNQYALNKLLSVHKGEFLQTTPTKFKALTAEPSQRGFLKNVKAILLGGEAMEASYLKELRKITDAEIYNIYGATEVPIWSTFADTNTFIDSVTIGKPIANTAVYIVDRFLNPVPIGVTGELCIAGDSVSAGYLNRSELTAEKFVDNPFGKGKMYRTGDNAYWREDGNIGYVGRSDFQVKIRGLRIELGEIESAVQAVAGIERAVVVVRKDKSERQLICAFYTGEDKTAKELRKEIGKKLPKYMLPHIFTHLEKMPLTSSGKANRNALPEIDLENIGEETEYVAPVSEKEKIVAECIKSVLGTERVSVLDNFFDIGGDSLKAIELTAKLEERGYTVAIKSIFSCSDMRTLAAEIYEKETKESKAEYDSVIPATAAQMRVYTAQMMKPDSVMYNITYAFRTNSIDLPRLEKAVNQLVQRHESLRTHFENRDGSIVQVIDDNAEINVEAVSDINSFSKAFDLAVSPLVRVGCTENTVTISVHHIIADGESLPVLFRELNELYMGRSLPGTVQYGEFSVTDKYTEDNEKYWLEVFKEEVPVLELSSDYPRMQQQSFNGSNIYEQVDISLHRRIEEKCRETAITPYAYYMACFSVLLSKLSGNEDIVIGTPMSGREGRYLNTVGMFVNTVALRSRPEGDKKVSELLGEIGADIVRAIENQSYPFGKLCKKLNIAPTNRNSLFQVMFAYQSFGMTDIIFGDSKAELIPLVSDASKYDITFNILPREADVVLATEYCTDLFSENTIRRFVKMYVQLLEQCLDSEKLIKDISVTDLMLTENINSTHHSYTMPETSTLYSLFENTAKLNVDKTCIRTAEKNLTFGELLDISEKLDVKIREITRGSKSVVAVIAERSAEMYSAIYGIIRGGNAYLPIDPDYPQDRIDYILENSGAVVVAVQWKFADKVKNIPCINVTDLLGNYTDISTKVPVPCADSNDTAYVVYTSGSTGTPKGAKVSHKSAINRILWMHDKYPLGEKDVILQKTPYTFDVSVWEIFWWGLCGGCLATSKPGEHFLPAKILDEVEKNKVTHLHFVPSVFELFLVYLEAHKSECVKFDSVRYVFLSGEVLTANLIQRFYKLYDYRKVSLHNLYGPTECAVDVTYYDCKPEDVDPIPIGKPIYNTQIYVADKYGKLVPAGVIGELCVTGDNVGQGYLNNPALTAERFIDNPFGCGKLYKTGDLSYLREDGNIIFVGRKDSQVKLNGQRIELGEIESVISGISDIDSVAVTVRKSESKDYLVAYYTGKEIETSYIKEICSAKLPRYMVPNAFVRLEKLPLNRSGKLDRKLLSEKDIRMHAEETELPVNDTERHICELFAAVLGEKNIGRNSDFFELGGTSYSMISILSEDSFEGVTAAEFMRSATPAHLGRLLDSKKEKELMYLEALYLPVQPKKYLFLLPFAGGGAEAYSSLTASVKRKSGDTAVYFIRYLHSAVECEGAAFEIAEIFAGKEISFYSHCVGSALALSIILQLEGRGVSVTDYFAAASIPPARPTGKNVWNKVSDKVLGAVLSAAGADLSALSDEKLKEMFIHFREDTDFANISFFELRDKIKAPVTVILSKRDIFTLNYRKAERLWKRYADNVSDVLYIDGGSHYFQSSCSDRVADILLETNA